MMLDPHTQTDIYTQGIWVNSQCLNRELSVCNWFAEQVQSRGWISGSSNNRIWRRGNKQLIICLVDDIRTCCQDYSLDTPYLFDQHTTVITDNYISTPTQYSLLTVPPSFFGIYCQHTETPPWQPDRDFAFAVNRIDHRRLQTLFELAQKISLDKGYVNFNCQTHRPVSSIKEFQDNFQLVYNELDPVRRSRWNAHFETLAPQMPLKNYQCDYEDIHNRSWCNIVIETYGSDGSAAFSEKIFRAMVLPVPWTAYLGHYGIAYLHSLGFDCLLDLVNHQAYDSLKEMNSKSSTLIEVSLLASTQLRYTNQSMLIERLQKAAHHNQQILQQYHQSWPNDLAAWWEQNSKVFD